MAFNRSKYQASSMESIKKEEAKKNKTSRFFGENSKGWTPFHTVDKGKNVFRIMPAHDPRDSAYAAFRSSWLNCVVDERDKDGKATGKKEIKLRRVFIATQHCEKVLEAGLPDPIEFYIGKCFELAEEIQNKTDREKFLFPVQGGWVGKKYVGGIVPLTSWVCYALSEDRSLGRLELRDKWFKDMQKKSAEQTDDSDLIVSLDIFSSPDDGFPLSITRSENEKGKTTYDIDTVTPKRGQSWEEFFDQWKITDAELIDFESKPSLCSLYIDSYTTKDLELALNGLRQFEKQNPEFNILATEEFEDIIKKLKKVIPVLREEEGDALSEALSNEETEEITPIKMRKFLKEYIDENYGGCSLPGHVKGDVLKKWYYLAVEGEELPFEQNENEEGEEDNALQPSAHPEELSEADRAAVKENLRKKILGK